MRYMVYGFYDARPFETPTHKPHERARARRDVDPG